MELLSSFIKSTWELFLEIVGAIWPMIKIAVSFVLWVLAAILILPCVFIASVIYPLWEEWGENF